MQLMLQPQVLSAIVDSGIGVNWSVQHRTVDFHLQPYCSRSGNFGSGICTDFHCKAV